MTIEVLSKQKSIVNPHCVSDSEIPARLAARTHLHQWWGTIAIIRNHRPPSPHDTYSNSRTTMRVYFKVNKLSLMPNLRRPVNNASSRNYLNACKCIRYDLFAGPSHCLARYMLCNYAVSITVDSTGSIRTIDWTTYKTLFLVAQLMLRLGKTILL